MKPFVFCLFSALLFSACVGSTTGAQANDGSVPTFEVGSDPAASLEHAIRNSDSIGFFTKLKIRSRYQDLEVIALKYGRGAATERDLRGSFDLMFSWLERVFAKSDPRLRLQLVKARPALWQKATNQ